MRKLWLCMLLVVVCGCSSAETKDTKKNADNNTVSYCDDAGGTCGFGTEADMSAYEGFDSKDAMFEESDMAHLLSAIESKSTGMFYLGYPSCPWCVEALPILNEVAKEHSQHIAYVRTRDDQKELMYTEEQKKALIDAASSYMQKDTDGNYQIYVPFFVVIKEGKVVDGHVGTVDGHDAHERVMNEDEKSQLKDIFTKMLQLTE